MRRRRLNPARRVGSRQSMQAAARRRKPGLLRRLFSSASKTELRLEVEHRVARDIWAIFYITFAILTYLALGGGIGAFGEWWEATFRGLFGIGATVVPLIFLAVGAVMLTSATIQFNFTRVLGIMLLVMSLLGIIHLDVPESEMWRQAPEVGGAIGFAVAVMLRLAFDVLGAKIILFALFLIAALLIFGISLREVIAYLRGAPAQTEQAADKLEKSIKKALVDDPKEREAALKEITKEAKEVPAKPEKPQEFRINRPAQVKLATDFKPQKSKISDEEWVPPALDLLEEAKEGFSMDEEELKAKAEVIRQKLLNFGIEVTMQDVNIGPSVMQYTLKPAEGVKLSKIKNLKHDLALALSAKSLRIEAPIPGRNVVGIEIPNSKRVAVRMRELLMSDNFAKIKSNLRLTLGRDVSGHPLIADLAKMPHMLVAGQTGSGKSVGINSFLLSLIYQNSPNDLRLILVDPKRVELVPYNGIPHLLTPVINDPEKTVSALKWAVAEMTRRYIELSKIHVRNIEEYNAKDPDEKMPFIVIVIDELADLMMVAGKEVEACICRLAQMARAVGIHLIIATQRPSVDVITGLIKANIPTRLSFRVAQGVDSKTILDCMGAEDLLGQGDMLFIPPGQSEPVRVQGAFVTTEEVRKVTNAIKLDLGDEQPEYNDEITDAQKAAEVVLPGIKREATSGAPGSEGSDEATLIQAARVVVETGRASASLLQRRLSLGYARAARIVDLMEERGFVGAPDGAKPRPIYITAEKLAQLESGTTMTDEEAAARETQRKLDEMERGRG
jgi:S-DNA-T family DNA segregation ATPase FtsK/SpoIIIE